MTKIPDYVSRQYGGVRKFKATKRAQIKGLIKAANELRLGCAFFPNRSGQKATQIYQLLKELADECSAKKWGH